MAYAKLRGKIREVYGTECAFAKAMGVTRSAMSMRLNNKSRWMVSDVRRAMDLLGIPETEIGSYFFWQESSEGVNQGQRRGRKAECATNAE